jgi:hypothetical protein
MSLPFPNRPIIVSRDPFDYSHMIDIIKTYQQRILTARESERKLLESTTTAATATATTASTTTTSSNSSSSSSSSSKRRRRGRKKQEQLNQEHQEFLLAMEKSTALMHQHRLVVPPVQYALQLDQYNTLDRTRRYCW